MKDKFLQFRDYFLANKKRSIIILLLVVLLPIGVFVALQQTVFNPRADRAKVGLSLSTPDGKDKPFGNPIPVNVSLYKSGNATIVGAGVKIEYDPTLVEPVNAPAKEGCYIKGVVQVCPATTPGEDPFLPFPFMPKDPIVDAQVGTIAFSMLSFNEQTQETTEAFTYDEFKDFATIYFKPKYPGTVNFLIRNDVFGDEGEYRTTNPGFPDDSSIAGGGSTTDYLVNEKFNTNIVANLELNIQNPVPDGVFSVKEVPAEGVVAYPGAGNTIEVEGWVVSSASTVVRYEVIFNGRTIDFPRNDARVTKIPHPEVGVCGGAEAQAKFPDCANGANVGFRIKLTSDELGVNWAKTGLENDIQKLEVKAFAEISQGDEFPGSLGFGVLGSPKELTFHFDDPANKGNPATYTVNQNGNNFAVNIKPQRAAGTFPYVGLVINGNKAQPKRLEAVSSNPVEFKWDSTNTYDGQTFPTGLVTVRLYARCTYNEADMPTTCEGAGIQFEPYSFQLGGSAGQSGLTVSYTISPTAPQANQQFVVTITNRSENSSNVALLVNGVSQWAATGSGGNGTTWNVTQPAGTYTIQLAANCVYAGQATPNCTGADVVKYNTTTVNVQ